MKKYILIPFLLIVVAVLIILAVAIVKYYDYPEIDAPEGFTVLKHESSGEFRAVSGDDCMIEISEEENIHEFTLDFIVDKVEKVQTLVKQYALIEKQEFATQSGEPGKYLVFEHMVDGIMYTYVVGIVSNANNTWVIKAAGEKEVFVKHKDAILASFTTLH